MREIEQQSRIYLKYTAMKTPLANHLHFDGMTKYGNGILLRQAEDIPEIDPHTKIYLCKISTTTNSIPDQAQHISPEEYDVVHPKMYPLI